MDDKSARIAALKARIAKRKEVAQQIEKVDVKELKRKEEEKKEKLKEFMNISKDEQVRKKKTKTLNFNIQQINEKEEQAKRNMFKRELMTKGIIEGNEKPIDKEISQENEYVEWWDKKYINSNEYPMLSQEDIDKILHSNEETIKCSDKSDVMINMSEITLKIQHPKIEEREVSQVKIKTILTKEEAKKARKVSRQERFQKERDEIAIGIREKPKDKVTLKNMANVYKEEMVINPTEVERKVRAEMEQRQQEHERRNQERKLSKEERKKKNKDKLKQDMMNNGIVMNVYKIKTLGKNIGRIVKNAREWVLTGLLLITPNNILLIVEGGMKGIKKFDGLCKRRMKWDENAFLQMIKMEEDAPEDDDNNSSSDDDNSDDNDEENGTTTQNDNDYRNKDYCKLIWQGKEDKLSFKTFSVEEYKLEQSAIDLLKLKQLEHLWKLSSEINF